MSDPDAQATAQALLDVAVDQNRAAAAVIPTDADAARAALDAALGDDPQSALCLIYTAPAAHLARILGNDDRADLEAATADWAAQAQHLCDLYRQNRQRCILFEAGALRRFSQTGFDRLGLAARAEPFCANLSTAVAPDAPMLMLAANAHLENCPRERSLALELMASTQPLSNADDAPLPATAALSATRAQAQALQVAQSLAQAQAQTIAELHAARALHEETHQKLEAELRTAHADREQLQDRLSQSDAARDLLHQQSTLLMDERRALADALARKSQDMEQQRQDHAAALQEMTATAAHDKAQFEDTRTELEHEIGRIMSSRSMRMTAPLRAILRVLRND